MKTRLELLDEKRRLASELASGVRGEVYKGVLRKYYRVLDLLKDKKRFPIVKK